MKSLPAVSLGKSTRIINQTKSSLKEKKGSEGVVLVDYDRVMLFYGFLVDIV